jgi:hypothetical protein
LSAINTLAFELTVKRSVRSWDRNAAAPAAGRTVAALSLVLWIGVIFLGRWVGFSSASAPAPTDTDIKIENLENLLPK